MGACSEMVSGPLWVQYRAPMAAWQHHARLGNPLSGASSRYRTASPLPSRFATVYGCVRPSTSNLYALPHTPLSSRGRQHSSAYLDTYSVAPVLSASLSIATLPFTLISGLVLAPSTSRAESRHIQTRYTGIPCITLSLAPALRPKPGCVVLSVLRTSAPVSNPRLAASTILPYVF